MAYDASNNKQDQNQVVSSTPLSGGQQPAAQTQPQDSQPNQAPSQPSTVQAGMSSTQAGAAQQPTQQKSASSGMFTNIQKYVQKNKPQAQKMASAVTQNVGSQASEIAEQAKQKEAQMKESLAANTAAMEAQKKEAGQIVGGIMGADYDPTTGEFKAQPAQTLTKDTLAATDLLGAEGIPAKTGQVYNPETGSYEFQPQQTIVGGEMQESNTLGSNIKNPYEGKKAGDIILRPKKDEWGRFIGTEKVTVTQDMIDNWGKPLKSIPSLTPEEQQARFQELMQGPTGISQVGNLNLAQQNQKARALQQLAGTANTEMGRRGLLQDTFRKGGDEYTSGMGGLDQLIVSGDETARTQLVEGVQQQADQLNQQIQDVGSEANKAKMAQDLAMKNFGTDIAGLGEEAQAAIIAQVDQQVDDQQKALEAEITNLKIAAGKDLESRLKYKNEQEFFQGLMGMFAPSGSKGGVRDAQDVLSIKAMLDDNMDLKEELKKRGLYLDRDQFGIGKMADISNTLTLGYGGTGQTRLNNMFEGLLTEAKDFGLDPNVYRDKLKNLAKSAYRSDLYGRHEHTKGSKSGLLTYDADKFKQLVTDLYSDIRGSDQSSALRRQLENKYGLDAQAAEDFMSGASIDRAGVATADQASKMEGLRGLLGRQTDELGTELGESADIGGDTEFFKNLKSNLASFIPKVRSGGTGSGGGPRS